MTKESYFTEKSIQQKSKEILKSVLPLKHRHLRQEFVPAHSALLVLDMQHYFLDPDSHAFIPSAISILPGLQKMISAYSSIGQPVIFTRHLNTEVDAGMMSKWWGELLDPRTARSQIIESLDVTNHIFFEKTQYDAFFGTRLDKTLRQSGVEQIVVTGVMTHLCCETTARSAFMHGFNVFFPIDGTATYSEAHHRASVLNLAHGFAVPLLVDDILSQI